MTTDNFLLRLDEVNDSLVDATNKIDLLQGVGADTGVLLDAALGAIDAAMVLLAQSRKST